MKRLFRRSPRVSPLRKSDFLLVGLAAGYALLLGLVFLHPLATDGSYQQHIAEGKRLVSELMLTDLCLFTEARYTRHPSQADLFTAFQDHPGALEHFPSGSVVAPPPMTRIRPHDLD